MPNARLCLCARSHADRWSVRHPSATCLGPPAQAIVGTTQDAVSLASVTLAPRKTSLWTSAISPSLLALGCDKKVLTTADPGRPQMEAYVTGGKHGDGAVFALDLGQVSSRWTSIVLKAS